MMSRAEVALKLGEAILDMVQGFGVFNKKRGRKPKRKAKPRKKAKAEKTAKPKKDVKKDRENPIDDED